MLVPIIVALIYGEYKYITPFIYSSIISLVIGVFLFKRFNNQRELSLKSAMIFVTLIWLIGSAIAALPYYLSGDLSYLNAYFEAMSGFTTTGFSMYNLDYASFTMNFWRAFTQWLRWNWYYCNGINYFIITRCQYNEDVLCRGQGRKVGPQH